MIDQRIVVFGEPDVVGSYNKRIVVFGAAGFIGSHMCKRLKSLNNYVIGVDIKMPEFGQLEAQFYDQFHLLDLRVEDNVINIINEDTDYVFQFACLMGGAGFIFTGDNDAEIMHNSALINLHTAKRCALTNTKVFWSSSACIYPEYNQLDPLSPLCSEVSAYPANPDSEYGWEKLFSERMYFAFNRNANLDIKIARFHNIFGPLGTYIGGKEKAPAALCRKVIEAKDIDEIEIWGDGEQTRSFLYIDDCIEAILQLMQSEFRGPVNIGSEEMVTINELAQKIIDISGKNITLKHIPGPLGVRGRNSDNKLFEERIGPLNYRSLSDGLKATYDWIKGEINDSHAS